MGERAAIDHGLTPGQLQMLRSVLYPFADHIRLVGLFGSRATGRAGPRSDIDLVLYGPVTQAEYDRLYTVLNDIPLPIGVDLVAYEHVTTPGLKDHIDRVMLPLWTGAELAAEA